MENTSWEYHVNVTICFINLTFKLASVTFCFINLLRFASLKVKFTIQIMSFTWYSYGMFSITHAWRWIRYHLQVCKSPVGVVMSEFCCTLVASLHASTLQQPSSPLPILSLLPPSSSSSGSLADMSLKRKADSLSSSSPPPPPPPPLLLLLLLSSLSGKVLVWLVDHLSPPVEPETHGNKIIFSLSLPFLAAQEI